MERAHPDNLHEGKDYARKKYSATRVLDHRIQKCIKSNQSRCVKYRYRNANKNHPQMADLLRERLDEQVFALINAGLDYFGLFEAKFLRRSLNEWHSLFTSLTTRSVHIEVAHPLDTNSCLAAVTKFIARRGYPNTIKTAQAYAEMIWKRWTGEFLPQSKEGSK